MIFYNPTDGDALTSSVRSTPKRCFLMTRLGRPVPALVKEMRNAVAGCCRDRDYKLIDAAQRVTGRDFLVKIWKLIAASPVAIGVAHEEIGESTQANIYYELGVAQAMGKETVIIKSPKSTIPSDLVRTEHIVFNQHFRRNFNRFLRELKEQAEHYEVVADQLDRNPILAMDYLKRAYLITGDFRLRSKAKAILKAACIENRAKNSVELLSAAF